jgi:hypothetical protein
MGEYCIECYNPKVSSGRDLERKVLIEAEKWYRQLLRRDEMGPHEEGLFMAIAEWRRNLEHATHIPRGSKLPSTILPPPLLPPEPKESEIRPKIPELDLDLISTRPVIRTKDEELRTTKPVPPNQQAYLVKKMNLPPLPLLKRTS